VPFEPPTPFQTVAPAIVALALALPIASPAQAQAGATQPGRVERDRQPVPEPFKRDGVRIDAPRFPEQVPPGAQASRFVLGEVQVSGNQALPTLALSLVWTPLLGKSITLAQAFGIAFDISARYRAAGFILSQAIVPAQELRTDGPAVLRIEVLEGFIDQVVFSGNAPVPALQAHLERVRQERPLRLQTLERGLLLVNELPGVSAQANIRPGASPNASELEVVAQRRRTDYSLSAHNRSTASQGRVRYEASAEVHGALADYDRHNLRWVTSASKRLNLLAYGGEWPLGGDGLKLQLGASVSKSEPSTDALASHIDTRSNNYSLGLAYPVLRSRQANLGLRSTFNAYDNHADGIGGRLSQDRVRALRLGVTGDRSDGWGGISLLDLEWSKGLSGLGADREGDPGVTANPQFSRFNVYVARLQNLGGRWSALLAGTAQRSRDRLPTAEQLGLGGETFLRAFDPSEVIGEEGAAAKLELRCDVAAAGLAGTLYAYRDIGHVTRRQNGGASLSNALSSTGIGIRMSGPHRTRGYLELAKPGSKDVASEGNRKPRVFAGGGVDF